MQWPAAVAAQRADLLCLLRESFHHSMMDHAETAAAKPDRRAHLRSSDAAATDPCLPEFDRTADPEPPNAGPLAI